MKFIGNILWLILGGFFISLYYAIVGLVFCLTIIGIPFGVQLFKMAGFAFWPFGHEVTPGAGSTGCLSLIMNIIWIVFGGIEIALTHIGLGIAFCVTIVGIPFGLQHFKMVPLAFMPFGTEIS